MKEYHKKSFDVSVVKNKRISGETLFYGGVGGIYPAGHKLRIPSNYAVIKKKTLLRRIFLFLAEWVGFEPTCRCYRQTDFESAPL